MEIVNKTDYDLYCYFSIGKLPRLNNIQEDFYWFTKAYPRDVINKIEFSAGEIIIFVDRKEWINQVSQFNLTNDTSYKWQGNFLYKVRVNFE